MSCLLLCPPRDTPQKDIFQYKELETCSHVFLRRIAIAPPLTAPYNEPYKFISRSGRVIKILMKGKVETVTVDRVKPSHFERELESGTTAQQQSRPKPKSTTSKQRPSTYLRDYVYNEPISDNLDKKKTRKKFPRCFIVNRCPAGSLSFTCGTGDGVCSQDQRADCTPNPADTPTQFLDKILGKIRFSRHSNFITMLGHINEILVDLFF